MLITFHPTTTNVRGQGQIHDKGLFAKYNINPNGILHIGAHRGQEIESYDLLGIKKQIWIEGDPDKFLPLKQNLSHNPYATAFNYVLGDENRPCVFNVANNDGQSSSVLELGFHKVDHPDIHYVRSFETTMHRLDSLDIDLTGVDFLNIDVQGAELMVLRGMGDLLKQFKWAYLEVNKAEEYIGCPLIETLDLFMIANHFRRVETKFCGRTSWGDALYIK